ncbi:hypothetical protein ACU4GR_30535 [Methylobacterium oryzae CBMB20]
MEVIRVGRFRASIACRAKQVEQPEPISTNRSGRFQASIVISAAPSRAVNHVLFQQGVAASGAAAACGTLCSRSACASSAVRNAS